jgi:hemoglobin
MFTIGDWRRTRTSLLGGGLLLATALLVTPPSQAVEGDLSQLESAVESSSGPNESDDGKSLYERLGGYEAISAVVEDFAPKLFEDPRIAHYFRGMGDDTRQQFMQKNKNLVCNVTGGPCKIISRPAKTVHGGLGITEREFNIVVEHLVQTLDKFKVPPAEKSELLEIIGSLKPDIVEKK